MILRRVTTVSRLELLHGVAGDFLPVEGWYLVTSQPLQVLPEQWIKHFEPVMAF